nr:hypothetical protein CFP56_41517 [Quercus suber]
MPGFGHRKEMDFRNGRLRILNHSHSLLTAFTFGQKLLMPPVSVDKCGNDGTLSVASTRPSSYHLKLDTRLLKLPSHLPTRHSFTPITLSCDGSV